MLAGVRRWWSSQEEETRLAIKLAMSVVIFAIAIGVMATLMWYFKKQ